MWYIDVQSGASKLIIDLVKNTWSSKNIKIFLEYSLPTWANFLIKIIVNLKNSIGI